MTKERFAILLTIRPNFNSGTAVKYFRLIIPYLLVAGCAGIPIDVLRLPPDNLAKRQQQTRQYLTTDEEKILLSKVTKAMKAYNIQSDKSDPVSM